MNSRPDGRRHRREVDTPDYLLMIARIVRNAGYRVGNADVEDLATLVSLRRDLDVAIDQAVQGLRDAGTTWDDIGEATGTTRQAAIQKWNRPSGEAFVPRRPRRPRSA